jgi:hypothetical protein
LPPERPEDRFCRLNPSCDGGFELLEESIPNRRFNSATSASSPATRAVNRSIVLACNTTNRASSSYDGRCGSASGTPKPCHTNRSSVDQDTPRTQAEHVPFADLGDTGAIPAALELSLLRKAGLLGSNTVFVEGGIELPNPFAGG